MSDIIGLVLPFFGMIFLGFAVARITRQPVEALGWMNTFVIYVALPCLFFQLLSRTPIEKLTEMGYIFGSVLATYLVFSAMFVFSVLTNRGEIAESTIKGLAAAYGNIGYMGPGLALLAFGEEAAVPVALIFCFENIMHFAVAPLMMALAGDERGGAGQLALGVVRKIALHPFIIATAIGVAAAALHVRPPTALATMLDYLARAAAPCALFAMGVTLALRPLKRMPREIGLIAVLKLVVHPALCYVILSLVGNFDPAWVFSAVLLASLPTATNVFVIGQQSGVWVERAEPGHAGELGRQQAAQQRAVEQVDRAGAGDDVDAPPPVVVGKCCLAARIVAMGAGNASQFLDVADAEIEALRADRRNDVSGLAEQRDAAGGEARRRHGGERIDLPARLHRHLAEHRLHGLLDAPRQRLVGKRGERFGFGRSHHPDEAGAAAARQRHLRERPGLGVEFGGDGFVVALMREVEHQRRLRQRVGAGGDARRLARR
jgi:predicted permease